MLYVTVVSYNSRFSDTLNSPAVSLHKFLMSGHLWPGRDVLFNVKFVEFIWD